MTIDEILEALEQNTHTLWSADFVKKVNEAFGTKLVARMRPADPSDPKGLTLHNGDAFAQGLASFEIAPAICAALGAKYEGKIGRGSQVRSCVAAARREINRRAGT